jgi:methyl-accepting chemotaxis protein
MDEMMTAVKDINVASQSINKVIKVIDDIAFQTNILALNAAVEAARAGQHGKGFAVVAEEVRSLAAKSAEAAKDTGGLIANSMEKAELGARIADDTAASLVEIVSGINESSQIVTEIAKSSEEQSLGIAQINRGIDQVAQVVQQNSATAEESAAASEEMSGQANMLEELVSQFKLKGQNGSKRLGGQGGKGAQKLVMPAKTTYAPPQNGDFGKY